MGCPSPLGNDSAPERLLELLCVVADEAMRDAGLTHPPFDVDSLRAGTLIGLSKGGIQSLARLHQTLREQGQSDSIAGEYWTQTWPSCGAGVLAARYGFCGPSAAPIAACATGLVAAIQGAALIRRGVCDLVLAGSVDASLEPIVLASLHKMRVLARASGDPATAVRPWDRGRTGFVVGEGGAVLVLEREDHVRRRGVVPYVELAGGALGADAYHETDLNPDPSGLAEVIRRSLNDASVSGSGIDHVNVHGTATRANDPIECQALRLALGPEANRIACTANKSQVGHLLGAAGAVELAITCLAMRDGFVPPTLNLDDPDPACDLDGTPHVGRAVPIRAALKLSIGFGGHLAASVLRLPEGPRRMPQVASDD